MQYHHTFRSPAYPDSSATGLGSKSRSLHCKSGIQEETYLGHKKMASQASSFVFSFPLLAAAYSRFSSVTLEVEGVKLAMTAV